MKYCDLMICVLAGGHCVVFLGKTLYLYNASVQPNYKLDKGEFNAAMGWHPIHERRRNTLSRLTYGKPG